MNGQGQYRAFVPQPLRKKNKEEEKIIFQGEPVEDPLLPLPYVLLTPQALAQPAPDPVADSPTSSVSSEPPHEHNPEPVGKWLCLSKQSNQLATAHQRPLRETEALHQVNEDGSVQPGHSIIYYQLFSTTDLLNWKHHNPVYSGKPQATTDLLECILYTHQPTWDDCGQFLMSLFTTEER